VILTIGEWLPAEASTPASWLPAEASTPSWFDENLNLMALGVNPAIQMVRTPLLTKEGQGVVE